MRRGDHVQLDDLLECDEHLARTQPDAVQLLVLHHQLQPLSDGDLQPGMGASVVRLLHVRRAGVGGCERTGTDLGQASLAAGRLGMDVGGVGDRRDDLELGRQSLGL